MGCALAGQRTSWAQLLNAPVTLLSVNANAPGHSFPNWKVAFKNARRLSDVLRCWANAYLGIDVAEEVPGGVKALAADKELSLDTKVGSLRETLRVRQGAYSLDILWPAEALPMAQDFCADFVSFLSNDVTLSPGQLLVICLPTTARRVPGCIERFQGYM
eukprot:s155_g42.t1